MAIELDRKRETRRRHKIDFVHTDPGYAGRALHAHVLASVLPLRRSPRRPREAGPHPQPGLHALPRRGRGRARDRLPLLASRCAAERRLPRGELRPLLLPRLALRSRREVRGAPRRKEPADA